MTWAREGANKPWLQGAKRLSALFVLLMLGSIFDFPQLLAQTSTGVIDGSVIDDAGAPVPRSTVSLMTEDGRVIRSQTADDRGLFVFDALTDGRYTVNASKLGYSTRTFGQTSQHAGTVVIALGTNGRFRARVRIPRLGVISGTIVDDQGQPISAEVRAQQFVIRGGRRVLDERIVRTTADQQGRYRFTDLPVGDYVVAAFGPDGELQRMTPDLIQRAQQAVQQRMAPLPDSDTARGPAVSYVPVYFPGVLNRARATPVSIIPGEERGNVNLQLQVTPTIRLQGTVVTAEGKPAPYVNVRLMSADDGNTWTFGQTTLAGVFNLAPVPFGAYTIIAGSTRTDLALTDPSASTITIRTEPGGSVNGRVVFDGTSTRPECRRTGCRPMLRVANPAGGAAITPDIAGVMDEGGPIAFPAVPPGSYFMGIGVPLPGWSMASAIIDGQDAMDLPMTVNPRQDLSGLIVTFTDRTTELTGSTPVGGTSPTADLVSIVAFPADQRFWVPGARRIRVARPDTRGDYRIAGLPPGEYLVAAVTNFNAEIELDAGRLSALQSGAGRTIVRTPEPR